MENPMRVEVDHTIKKGGFFQGRGGYVVKVLIQLSPSETSVVNERKLWKYIVIRRKNPFFETASESDKELMNEWYEYSIKKCCAGFDALYETPSDAKAFADADEKTYKLSRILLRRTEQPA